MISMLWYMAVRVLGGGGGRANGRCIAYIRGATGLAYWKGLCVPTMGVY